ncbi:hypothetical protein [Roseovarius sp. D0-M9]|uniref:hypothetical protein n=1 Tax=Roseovarius sp. D0-M9 TaxID=3127117 RepID=UPI0030101937
MLVVPFDWQALPMMYPFMLGSLPDWLFTNVGLALVVVALGYMWSEFRNIRRWGRFKWLSPHDAISYLRERLHADGLNEDGAILDMYCRELDIHDVVAMGYITNGINRGYIAARGTRENGVAIRDIPAPLADHSTSTVQKEPMTEAQVGSDGLVYRDLFFSVPSRSVWVVGRTGA